MSWRAARDWMRDLKARIQAGFQGKILTPPKGLPAAASQPIGRQEIGVAVIAGDLEKVKALLTAGADPNAEVSFTHPRWNRGNEWNTRVLVAAIVYRHPKVVDLLLRHKVSFKMHLNAFAICPAVNSRQGGVVAALIKAGIEVDKIGCIRQLTPLASAKRRGYREIIELLVEAGAI